MLWLLHLGLVRHQQQQLRSQLEPQQCLPQLQQQQQTSRLPLTSLAASQQQQYQLSTVLEVLGYNMGLSIENLVPGHVLFDSAMVQMSDRVCAGQRGRSME